MKMLGNGLPQSLMGMGVILHDDPKPERYERRDWIDRWFTRPWQPLLYWRWFPAEQRMWALNNVVISFGHIHCYRSEWDTIRREIQAAA